MAIPVLTDFSVITDAAELQELPRTSEGPVGFQSGGTERPLVDETSLSLDGKIIFKGIKSYQDLLKTLVF